jgi:tRNA threonylcarbamoyladenosine biosynthesis protein TsaB
MWLALDTSGETASVAIGRAGSAPMADASLQGARKHAGALVPMIDRLMAETKTEVAALEGILVTDGPGSFTGLRVSASVAKAIGLTRGLAVRTAPSLMVLAAGALPRQEGPVLALLDALRGELYAAVYEFGPGQVTTRLAPTVAGPDDLVAKVARLGVQGIVGLAPEPLLAQLHARLDLARLVPPPAGAPVLLGLLPVTGALTPVADLRRWEPEYGRPAEAQRKWEEAHGRPLPPPSSFPG